MRGGGLVKLLQYYMNLVPLRLCFIVLLKYCKLDVISMF